MERRAVGQFSRRKKRCAVWAAAAAMLAASIFLPVLFTLYWYNRSIRTHKRIRRKKEKESK